MYLYTPSIITVKVYYYLRRTRHVCVCGVYLFVAVSCCNPMYCEQDRTRLHWEW